MDKRNKFIIRQAVHSMKEERPDMDIAWNEIKKKTIRRRVNAVLLRIMQYAAILLVVAGAGIYIWTIATDKELPVVVADNKVMEISGFELLLANGDRISLDKNTKDINVEELGVNIVRDDSDGSLQYKADVSTAEDEPVKYNLLNVPKGYDLRMQLPDGSMVWLNSESSLRFPVKFSSDNRTVYLEGEAFFDVERDEKAPFYVYSGEKVIRVLGTRFNVSAYRDDPTWNTTWCKGKCPFPSAGMKGYCILPNNVWSIMQPER